MDCCVNCGIATSHCNTLDRRPLNDETILSVIRQWLAPQSLSLLQTDHAPLAAELSSRVASHAPRLQDAKTDARLPLPSPQEIDAIKRVAQVLIMLGGQVIPSIIGEAPVMSTTQAVTDVPHDAINN